MSSKDLIAAVTDTRLAEIVDEWVDGQMETYEAFREETLQCGAAWGDEHEEERRYLKLSYNEYEELIR